MANASRSRHSLSASRKRKWSVTATPLVLRAAVFPLAWPCAPSPPNAGIDYVCEVRLQCVDADRLRVEQRLSDPSGGLCLTLASDIALVAPR
jgi:hypothetical protein